MKMQCVFCKKTFKTQDKIGTSDICPKCGRALHCCRQCKFFDPNAYNECRQISPERVFDKDSANFCDFFVPKGSTVKGRNKVRDAKAALEAFFKK
ncbi:MAG: hypothetical protein J7J52_00525 [Deltaproteobacteria bacterium]|nr:hypothetical protein [Deltaproteobacteria bacterium]